MPDSRNRNARIALARPGVGPAEISAILRELEPEEADLSALGFILHRNGSRPSLVLFPAHRECWFAGKLRASLRRSKLLWRLLLTLSTEGDTLSREELYEKVWEFPYRGPDSDNALQVAINRLRKRLDGDWIRTLADGRYGLEGNPRVLSWIPSAPRLAPSKHQPTSPVTGLIGREDVLGRIREGLAGRDRLWTIHGRGGIGKTRLALEIAWLEHESDRWPGGVWILDLRDSESDSDLASHLATVLSVSLTRKTDSTAIWDTLSETLERRKPTLLVLDGPENLLNQSLTRIRQLLATASNSKILLSTRIRSRLSGERCVSLKPLDSESGVALFVRNAGRGKPDDPDIRRLVETLDGSPLAIEMAAARATILNPREILAQLEEGLGQLHRKRPDGEAETLRDVVQWSWSLLGPDEQNVLMQCALFRGGFQPKSAMHVVESSTDLLDVLGTLRDCSMLRGCLSEDDTWPSRFELPADVREFVREQADIRLGPRPAKRHAEWFVAFGEERLPRLTGDGAPRALEELEAELENGLCVARGQTIEDPDLRARATRILAVTMERTGPLSTLTPLVDELLGLGDAVSPYHRSRLWASAAWIETVQGELNKAITHTHEALNHAGTDDTLLAEHFSRLGTLLMDTGSWEAGLEAHRSATRHARLASLPGIEARSLCGEAGRHWSAGRFTESRELLEQALEHAYTAEDRVLEGVILRHLGSILVELGSPRSAEDHLARALSIARVHDDHRRELGVLNDQIILYTRLREEELGLAAAHRALDIARGFGNSRSESNLLLNRGELHRVFGNFESALADTRRAHRMFHKANSSGVTIAEVNLGMIRHEQGELREALNHYRRALPALERSGGSLVSALTHSNMALVHHERGDTEAARKHHETAWTTLSDEPSREAFVVHARAAAFLSSVSDPLAETHRRRARHLLEDLVEPGLAEALCLYEGQMVSDTDRNRFIGLSDEFRLALRLRNER